MSGEMANLNSEWKNRIESSPEAKKAKFNLEFHRKKINRMHEEMSQAEAWEKELERRFKNVKEQVKPPLLILTEQLETSKPVDDSIIEASINENDPEKLISLFRRKAMSMKEMNRSELLGFVKTVLGVRNGFLMKDNQYCVGVLQEIASGALKQLGRATINWQDLNSWEADFMKLLILEVEGMPGFISRFMEQILTQMGTQSQGQSDMNIE